MLQSQNEKNIIGALLYAFNMLYYFCHCRPIYLGLIQTFVEQKYFFQGFGAMRISNWALPTNVPLKFLIIE